MWATAADIEPGAVVALHSHIDGTLVVRTGVESEADPLTLSVADTDPAALERTLRAAYTAGVDSVELTSPDGATESTHRRVDRVTRALTGVTVTDPSDDGMGVRSLLDVEEVSITQSPAAPVRGAVGPPRGHGRADGARPGRHGRTGRRHGPHRRHGRPLLPARAGLAVGDTPSD